MAGFAIRRVALLRRLNRRRDLSSIRGILSSSQKLGGRRFGFEDAYLLT